MSEDLSILPDADDQKLIAQVMAYYQRTFHGSSEAQKYLRKRGITNGQAVAQFGIGYADRSLGLTLPGKQVKAGREIRGRLQALGLFRESGHEHFNGSVVFPIYAADGTRQILDAYGRKIQHALRKGTPLHTYLSNERSGVWNLEAFGATDEVILCPSLFDALTFWSNGYRNVTCMFGSDALTADHLAAFTEFHIKRVLTPCEAVCPRLMDKGIDCFRIRFPTGMDANAFACRAEKPSDVLGAALRSATWIGHGKKSCFSVVPRHRTGRCCPERGIAVDHCDADRRDGIGSA